MRTSSFAVFGLALALTACSHAPTAPAAENTESPATAAESLREPSSNLSGITLNCFGTQSNKGARATVIFKGANKEYSFTGTRLDGARAPVKIECAGRRDTTYKAESTNPHFDRYVVNADDRKCSFSDAFVARTIVEDRAGSFSFMGECGRGDFCSATYYCKENQ